MHAWSTYILCITRTWGNGKLFVLGLSWGSRPSWPSRPGTTRSLPPCLPPLIVVVHILFILRDQNEIKTLSCHHSSSLPGSSRPGSIRGGGQGWLNRLPCLTSLTTTLKRLLLLLTFLSKMVKIWFIFLVFLFPQHLRYVPVPACPHFQLQSRIFFHYLRSCCRLKKA